MEIVWSKLAYEHFLEILIYVENNFGMLTAQKTRQKIQDKVNLLTRVRDKDCVKNRVKRAKIVRFTLC